MTVVVLRQEGRRMEGEREGGSEEVIGKLRKQKSVKRGESL